MISNKIIDELKKQKLISASVAADVNKKVSAGESLEKLLIALGVSMENILQAASLVTGVKSYVVGDKKIPLNILRQIPEESARLYRILPLEIASDGTIIIGAVDPEDVQAKEAIKFLSGTRGTPHETVLISEEDFDKGLQEYKGLGVEVTKVLEEFEGALQDELAKTEVVKSAEAPLVISEEAPITRMVATLLKHAVVGKASDIHIEPGREQLRVRFRIDGTLRTNIFLPMRVHEALISRIKILTNMQLDEKRRPQDGRFSATIDGRNIDFRVSSLPTYFGEKVVMRILDPESGLFTLEKLGLNGRNLEATQQALQKPYGLILITGPTGSGKSTTLYAMLQQLNDEKSNVISLEDPVEYSIEGVNQSQIRPELDYTFATGLRHILRQDPDVIMVGEIRDKETAQLAIHAALTGHMVFATLHTNNAIGVIPRLIDMGVDPFLIAPTLVLALGQRLVRTLCEDGKSPLPVDGIVKERIEKELTEFPPEVSKNIKRPSEIYKAKPSPTCPSGTRGRIAVFEVFMMTPQLEQIILKGMSEAALAEEAKRQGMVTMRQDGILKVLEGKIGLEQLEEIL